MCVCVSLFFFWVEFSICTGWLYTHTRQGKALGAIGSRRRRNEKAKENLKGKINEYMRLRWGNRRMKRKKGEWELDPFSTPSMVLLTAVAWARVLSVPACHCRPRLYTSLIIRLSYSSFFLLLFAVCLFVISFLFFSCVCAILQIWNLASSSHLALGVQHRYLAFWPLWQSKQVENKNKHGQKKKRESLLRDIKAQQVTGAPVWTLIIFFIYLTSWLDLAA